MKNILIAGATGGIGTYIAEVLFDKGYNTIITGRDDEKLRTLSKRIGDSVWEKCDLSDLYHIENLFDRLRNSQLRLDGFVYCAGINRDIPIRLNSIEAMQNVSTVNYMSFVEMMKFFLRSKYSNDGSSVVAISSSAVSEKPAGMCTYVGSKAALEASVAIAAKEGIQRKIRVNCIEPGFVDTDMVRQSSYVDIDKVLEKQKLGLVDPISIAYLVEFLLSDMSQYITGAVIPITGGV